MTNPSDSGMDNMPPPRSAEEAEQMFAHAHKQMQAHAPTATYPVSVPGEQYGMYGASLPTVHFKNRQLFFHSDFNQQAIQYFMMCLKFLASSEAMAEPERPRKITIYVSSPGGLVDDGCFMLDFIELIKEMTKEPVEIIVETRAASMGSLMTQAASSGRLMMHLGNISESVNMIHSLSYGHPPGKRDAHGRQYGESRTKMANLYRYYLRRIYRTLVTFHGREPGKDLMAEIFMWLKDHMEANDTFMDPIWAYEVGMCDFIVLNDRSRRQYEDALKWHEGFLKEVKSPGSEGAAETRLEPQTTRVQLSDEEQKRATERVIALQQQAYKQAKQLRDHKDDNAVIRALEELDHLREKEGSGPTHHIGEVRPNLISQVMQVFKDNLTDNDLSIDPTPDQLPVGSSDKTNSDDDPADA